MSLYLMDVGLDASDLGLQRFDPLMQLRDRNGVEILFAQRR